jgi:hypothetical protein
MLLLVLGMPALLTEVVTLPPTSFRPSCCLMQKCHEAPYDNIVDRKHHDRKCHSVSAIKNAHMIYTRVYEIGM